EKDPNFYEALSGLIVTYAGEKKLSLATQRIRTQIAKSPSNSAFYYLLAQVLRDQKDLAGAEGALNKSLELDKNNLDALALLGQIQVQSNALDRAEASYNILTKERPTDPRGYILLGAVNELKKNNSKAEEMYKQAIELQADNPIASNNLAFLIAERGGNLDVAMTYAETARKALPDSPNVADTLAWIYFKRGRYGLAIELLEESVHKEASSPTFHFHLGLAYQKLDNKPKAKLHLERALQLMPKGYPDADAARKALAELGG
nr:tetratricopeptide repeat protein [Acidobacteriota bacterium]